MPERTPDFLIGCSRPLFVQSRSQPHCGRFIETALSGDYVAAGAVLREIVAIADKLQSRYFAQGFHHVALFKAMSENNGLIGGNVRPPSSPPDVAELRECFEVMRAAGLR